MMFARSLPREWTRMLPRQNVHASFALAIATVACASSARDSSATSIAVQEQRDPRSSAQVTGNDYASAAAPKEVVDEIAKHAIAIATVEPGGGLADSRAMREWSVSGARVVALGEAAPGTHELFQVNRRLFELCVEEGFRVLAADVGWADALAVNDYVLRGTGDPKVALEGLRAPAWNTSEA